MTDDKPIDDQPASSTSGGSSTDKFGRQLFEVTCADCGKPTQVPFKPSGDRPVYCRDCFMKRRGGDRRPPTRR